MAVKSGSYQKVIQKSITVTSRQVFFSTQEFTIGCGLVKGHPIHVEWPSYPVDSNGYVYPVKEWVSDTGKITVLFFNGHSAAVTPGAVAIKILVL